ncbi:hypothetical protein MSPP1_001933 [Malassezia sp. CBS 17886]|nr:hypothetical protein MSPP1_001933 [Malassezia sp. CBS 17886]
MWAGTRPTKDSMPLDEWKDGPTSFACSCLNVCIEGDVVAYGIPGAWPVRVRLGSADALRVSRALAASGVVETTARPTDGIVWVSSACIQGEAIESRRASPEYSTLFSVVVLSTADSGPARPAPSTLAVPPALGALPSSLVDAKQDAPRASLDAVALRSLREQRAAAEREIAAFVREKQDALNTLVAHARVDLQRLVSLVHAGDGRGGGPRVDAPAGAHADAGALFSMRSATASGAAMPSDLSRSLQRGAVGGLSGGAAEQAETGGTRAEGADRGGEVAGGAESKTEPGTRTPTRSPETAPVLPADTHPKLAPDATLPPPTAVTTHADAARASDRNPRMSPHMPAARPPGTRDRKVMFAADTEPEVRDDDAPLHQTQDILFPIDEEVADDGSDVDEPATPTAVGDEDETADANDVVEGTADSGVSELMGSSLATSFSALTNSLQEPTHALHGDPHTVKMASISEAFAQEEGPYDLQERRSNLPGNGAGSQRREPRRMRHVGACSSGSNEYDARGGHTERYMDEDLALVGVLAANTPSHRSLHTARANRHLADGDRKWAPWQHRIRAKDHASASANGVAQSVPAHVAGPSAIPAPQDVQHRDAAWGVDREPKTSLPYNEKMFVPSLMQATRSHTAGARAQPSDAAPGAGMLSNSVRTQGFYVRGQTHASPPLPPPPGARTRTQDVPPLPSVPSAHMRLDPAAGTAPWDEPAKGSGKQDDLCKLLYYMHYLQNLKISKRTGWSHHNIPQPESIADHMYRMAMLAMLLDEDGIDLRKCVLMALVHDLAEAQVGDLTPLCNVDKEEKKRREHDAVHYFTHDLLGDSHAAQQIRALWMEYEERASPEARLVKDLDCFELCLQAYEYEKVHGTRDLQQFWTGAAPKIMHPRIRTWVDALLRKRRELWMSRGVSYDRSAAAGTGNAPSARQGADVQTPSAKQPCSVREYA